MSDNYVPITPNVIRTGIVLGFDLYLQVHLNGNKVGYILYCKRNNIIEPEKIAELFTRNINRLYIKSEDQKKFLEYTESSMKKIVSDNAIDCKIKSEIVYDVAKNIMRDVLMDPRSGENIERSKNWVYNTVEFIINDKSSSMNLINILSYDYYTYSHSVNVTILGLAFAKYLKFKNDEMNVLGIGLLLHDIGKTTISIGIINKRGRLNDHEYLEIKKHVEQGVEILMKTGDIAEESFFPIMQHHERFDGKGYPRGLKNGEIHKYGMIAKIVDVYDAITTRRSYSDARKPFLALKIMKEEMAGSFNEKLFREFILFLGSGIRTN